MQVYFDTNCSFFKISVGVIGDFAHYDTTIRKLNCEFCVIDLQGSYGVVKLAYNQEDDTHYVSFIVCVVNTYIRLALILCFSVCFVY